MTAIEVLSGPEQRRRWSTEEKRALGAAAFAPGAIVCQVAPRADVTPSLLYRWRRELCDEGADFARVVVGPAAGGMASLAPAIEVEMGSLLVRIGASAPPAVVSSIIAALKRE